MGQTWVMQLPPGVMDPMFTYELAESPAHDSAGDDDR